jgi:DNA-directed RNA polymerase subunit RPC12/RpoP
MIERVTTPQEGPGVVCPHCGFRVEPGSPVCGNCGRQFEEHAMPATIADSGTRTVKFAVAAAILVALGVLVFTAGGRAIDYFEDLVDTANVPAQVGDPGAGGSANSLVSPYASVRELAAALKEGGLACNQVTVDHADNVVATGSCQAPGDPVRIHVQINIYFQQASLTASEEIFSERAFTFVHDDNWFVITQLPVARKVHEILGGDLVRAK